ncbi:hypothetical protein BCR44DRAFT_1443345 [Catenaria anguillulae PL171]|uniref:BRCT domain-containing protein n=1 Tax=Catenaria anguillulae PL171 TaxID=765915 RepID=A0A1Y2H8X6_9FUNG|nr:hypothetical protein BCR44DRAFT_1443345 [Catenaria anguillulae PL171]
MSHHIVFFAPPTASFSIPYPTLLEHAANARLVVSSTLNPAVTLVVAASPTGVPANTPKSATCVSPQEFVVLAKSATPPPAPRVATSSSSATLAPKVKRVHAADGEDKADSPATSPKRARSTAAMDPAAHVVVFTGTLPSGRTRGEATAEAEEHGYTVKNSITKATTILVYGDKAGAKIEQARKQGVEVLSEAEWTARLGGGGEDAMDVDEQDDEEVQEKPKSATNGKAKSANGATSKASVEVVNMSLDDFVAKTGYNVAGGTSKVAAAPLPLRNPHAHTVVFTGTLPSGRSRDEAIKHAESLGYTAKNSITKATTILVYGDKAGSKIDKAREQGVLVLSEAEWMARVGDDAGDDGEDDQDEMRMRMSPRQRRSGCGSEKGGAREKGQAAAAAPASGTKKGVVVFSGTLPSGRTRGEATKEAEAAGYEVKNSITKATTILVTGEKGGSKIEKAKDQGVEVIDEDEWIARLAEEAEAEDE